MTHRQVKGLRLQVHKPAWFRGVEGVVTEMEFDDFTEKFPKNPRAIKVLQELGKQIPDLRCGQAYAEEPSPIYTLPEYLESLKK